MLKQRRVLQAAAALSLFLLGSVIEAQNAPFTLIEDTAANEVFSFENSLLNFSSVSPDSFVWNEVSEVPLEFVDAVMFSEFKQNFLGYDPVNRDRFEIQIYSGTIWPDRIMLAAGYSRTLSAFWGPTHFGTELHSPFFGEVYGGDNSSGVMKVSRISTIRRGSQVLIIRTVFDSDYFNEYSSEIARFIGSIKFEHPFSEDLVGDEYRRATSLSENAFETYFPPHWRLYKEDSIPLKGLNIDAEIWADTEDDSQNLSIMTSTLQIEDNLTFATYDENGFQWFVEFAYEFALFHIRNFAREDVPIEQASIEAQRAFSFAEFKGVVDFNAMYMFKLSIPTIPYDSAVWVLATLNKEGPVIVSSLIKPIPNASFASGTSDDRYLTVSGYHGDYVHYIQRKAMLEYWQKSSNQAQ